MRMATEMSGDDLNKLGYPVVVEMWDKVVGPGASGSKRRKYQAEFSEYEREKARKYYNLFYRWYLVVSTPDSYFVTVTELQFIERLINFFGTV